MKRLFLILILLVAIPGFAAADEDGRYRIVTTTVNLAGNDIPIALMIDSRTGASWFLAMAQARGGTVNERVPAWQEILYFPDLTTTPASSSPDPTADATREEE